MTGNILFGGTATSFSGSLENHEYMQLLVHQNGETLINIDTIAYLLVMVLLSMILFTTLISIFVWGFKFGFYLTSGGKLLGKK